MFSTCPGALPGPVAGMLLSDNGADVIKVEPPGGDPFRSTPGYAAWLRGRRSAALDLTDETDRTTFLALVRSADVVLESFSPGTTDRLGIDAETLLAREPTPDLLLDHRLRITPGPPDPSRLRRAGGGATRAAA